MYALTDNPYLVPFDGTFKVAEAPTRPPADTPGKAELKAALKENRKAMAEMQDVLYAHDRHAILLIFQAMDAAGKDSTIRAVMTGINPAGFQVYSFKKPSEEELDHDFLWRTARCLPERGRIGIFNRSFYEETLVVRVHPELLEHQKLPGALDVEDLWEERYASIRDHERHLARSGTVILKFWLNVSHEQQLHRFLRRIERSDKNWKFNIGDVKETRRWDDYMKAYEATLNATSRPWAPWYAIPADSKPFMRLAVSDIVRRTMDQLDLRYPRIEAEALAQLDDIRDELVGMIDAMKEQG